MLPDPGAGQGPLLSRARALTVSTNRVNGQPEEREVMPFERTESWAGHANAGKSKDAGDEAEPHICGRSCVRKRMFNNQLLEEVNVGGRVDRELDDGIKS